MEGKHDENKLKAKNSKEDDCPIRPIVCVKNPVNLKSVEETEDCFILDFDPSDLIDFSNLSLSKNSGVEDDACELTVIAEKGQVAARDCPNRSIVCVKNPVNLKSVEETEDCFILDFDPSDLIDFSKLSLSTNSGVDDDACELTVIAEKGQVAARDYPHSRHLCVRFPFDSTPHKSYCNRCYCYVCDSEAPCRFWTLPVLAHCDASDQSDEWKYRRNLHKKQISAERKLG